MCHHALQDFIVTVERTWPPRELGDGRLEYSFRTWNAGIFANDFPNVKANGRPFAFPGAVDITVGADGLIQSVDEFYGTKWDTLAGHEFYSKN